MANQKRSPIGGHPLAQIAIEAVERLAAPDVADRLIKQALLTADRRNATVVADERTKLAKVMIWDFKELLADNETLARRVDDLARSRS